MVDPTLWFNSARLPSWLTAFSRLGAEPGNFVFNPVKIVKFIRKRAPEMNKMAWPREPAY